MKPILNFNLWLLFAWLVNHAFFVTSKPVAEFPLAIV